MVLAGNIAADDLFGIPKGQTLRGRKIGSTCPCWSDALRLDVATRRASVRRLKCQGYRENGEIFLAHIWFSSYMAGEGPRLAAIVVDASEEMRDREEEGLQQLMRGNRMRPPRWHTKSVIFAGRSRCVCGT